MSFGLSGHIVAAAETLKADKLLAEKSDRTALIEITIETSRSQPAAGDGLGVSADIKNVSDSVLHIEAKEIDLVLPPELEGPGKSSTNWFAFLPTEPSGPPDDTWKASIDLKPGDSYKVFWTFGVREAQGQQSYFDRIYNVITSQMIFVFFPPGDYKIAVVCKYWPLSEAKAGAPPAYRTTAQTAIMHVAAPQFVILLGAALGGLIAYFILPQARSRLVQAAPPSSDEWFAILNGILSRILKELAGLVGAILLSAMITILLSRISETQFLIKVTITDIWGAIAIGFIANYVGAKALGKILAGYDSDSSSTAHKLTVPTETDKKGAAAIIEPAVPVIHSAPVSSSAEGPPASP